MNDLNVVHWWVDASYGTYPGLKGKTGATISIGKGCVTSASKVKKVSTTRPKISKVVEVNEASTKVLWTKALLQNQGFELDKATLYQDSMSAMLLEKNGRVSRSSQTKHIDIGYSFIQYRIDKGEIGLEYFHTDSMVANFMTKPLQEKQFFEFRDRIMGMSISENIAKGQKVRYEIAQKEDLESS